MGTHTHGGDNFGLIVFWVRMVRMACSVVYVAWGPSELFFFFLFALLLCPPPPNPGIRSS